MKPTRTFTAAALVAAAVSIGAGTAAAAPVAPASISLGSADVGTLEQTQYRRAYRGRWVGRRGHYVYGGAVPGYVVPGNNGRWGYGPQVPSPGSSPLCTPDRYDNSSFPSWMCR
jgi:hypothetical protein